MGGLRDFVADVLDSGGAAVEPIEPDGLAVLAPEPLRALLGWPEFVRLGFGVATPADAVPIRLEGDWLERFGVLIGERGRFAERQVISDSVAPPGEPERMLDRALDLPNATWRLNEVKPAWTRCLLLAFRYSAISDEKRDGLVWIGLNQGTGAALDGELLERLRALLASVPWRASEPGTRGAAAADADPGMLATRLPALVAHCVRRDLAPFLNAMRRRFDRDCARIYEYHDDLRRDAKARVAALAYASGERAEADRKRETMRIAAIEREYKAKLDDLRHNYAVRVTVDWVQGLALYAPVYRYAVRIKRRKGERIVHIDWHAAIRMIESPPCDWGPGSARTRWVCDDHLHLNDATAQPSCATCGKSRCGACHPDACPRCGAS